MSKTPKAKGMEMRLAEHISSSLIHEDNLHISEQYAVEYLALIRSVEALLWRTDLEVFRFAASFMDAIKLKFFPNWLLRRFPAKYIHVDIRVIYPELSKFPDKVNLKKIGQTKKLVVSTKRVDVFYPDDPEIY